MTEPGGFNFDELRKLLEQLGISDKGDGPDFESLLKRMQSLGERGLFPGMPKQDADASWRTTISAAKTATTDGYADPEISAVEEAQVSEAERLVQSWLDEFTSFASPGLPARALTRTGWLEDTGVGWRAIVDPIIAGHGAALGRNALGDDDEFNIGALVAPLINQSATLLYRNRLKRELAKVARDTLTGTEIGFRLSASARTVVLPANVAAFTADLEADRTDLLLVLVLRDAARQRLFHNVGWLAPQLTALLTHYAREIRIDVEAIAERFSPESIESMSLDELAKVGDELEISFFRPASTPEQLEVLDRLGLLLALVEGWVDHVTARTMEKWMPHAPQLAEVLRRRRAAGSPVRDVLRVLIGLELPSSNMIAAERLWAVAEHELGAAGRDRVWSHPDLLPTAEHLEDPHSFTRPDTPQEDDLDAELRKLLGN